MTIDSLKGLDGGVGERDELEFMVGSGAGTTMAGPGVAKAVKATDPHSNRT
ncbi:hypothetical protein N9L68_06035 [bacterium]|nr:hypothetical protein [bacterium]